MFIAQLKARPPQPPATRGEHAVRFDPVGLDLDLYMYLCVPASIAPIYLSICLYICVSMHRPPAQPRPRVNPPSKRGVGSKVPCAPK